MHNAKYLLCVQQKKETPTGLQQSKWVSRVNDDRIFIFGWSIPLNIWAKLAWFYFIFKKNFI